MNEMLRSYSLGETKHLRFYKTNTPHDCSYLPDQEASTVFVDPNIDITNEIYEQLTLLGFRRSGTLFYRPNCEACKACIPVRIPVDLFKKTKRYRRIINKNKDLRVNIHPARFEQHHYDLFEKYINERHHDGDMYPTSTRQYKSFLIDTPVPTYFCEFYLNDQLICVTIIDKLPRDISAVYTFFDPDFSQRSLGTYAILWLIEHTRALNHQFLYLGYWVKDCLKMNYKSQYRPLELLTNNEWILIN